MRYTDAIKLHSGDEVMMKGRGNHVCTVLEVRIDAANRDCFLFCDDGNTFHHTEVK